MKSAMPAAKILRRPRRSARRPDATRKAPKTMLYAFSTHDIVEIVEWGNDARMLGNATLTIVEVEKSGKAPKAAMTRTAVEVGALRCLGGAGIRGATASSKSAITISRRWSIVRQFRCRSIQPF